MKYLSDKKKKKKNVELRANKIARSRFLPSEKLALKTWGLIGALARARHELDRDYTNQLFESRVEMRNFDNFRSQSTIVIIRDRVLITFLIQVTQ